MHFDDLPSAGRALARELERYRGHEPIVVAIAAGGVPVAVEVATHLDVPFDLLFLRTLFFSGDTAVGIASVAGVPVYGALETIAVDSSIPDSFIRDALASFEERVRTCRDGAPPLSIEGRVVLLVDDGIRSGSTVISAVRALRPLKPGRIVLAVPVAAPHSRETIEREVDEMVVLAWPSPFGHVGMFFRRFAVPNDEQVRHIFERSRISGRAKGSPS